MPCADAVCDCGGRKYHNSVRCRACVYAAAEAARVNAPPCRHCHVQPSGPGKRGLCPPCYRRHEIRHLYPSTSRFAYKGIRDCCGERPLPADATAELPGSPAKIAILIERAEQRLTLWHEADVRQEHGTHRRTDSDGHRVRTLHVSRDCLPREARL